MTGAPCLGQTLNCIGHLDVRHKPGLSQTHHSVWSPGIVPWTGIHQSIINEKGSHQVHAFPQMGPDIPVNFPPETGFKIHNIQALSHLRSPLPPCQQPQAPLSVHKGISSREGFRISQEKQMHPFIQNETLSSSSSLLPYEHFPSKERSQKNTSHLR